MLRGWGKKFWPSLRGLHVTQASIASRSSHNVLSLYSRAFSSDSDKSDPHKLRQADEIDMSNWTKEEIQQYHQDKLVQNFDVNNFRPDADSLEAFDSDPYEWKTFNHHEVFKRERAAIPEGMTTAEYNTQSLEALQAEIEKGIPHGFEANDSPLKAYRQGHTFDTVDKTNFQDFTMREMKEMVKQVAENPNTDALEDGYIDHIDAQLPSVAELDDFMERMEDDDYSNDQQLGDNYLRTDLGFDHEDPRYDIIDPDVDRHMIDHKRYGEGDYVLDIVASQQEKLSNEMDEWATFGQGDPDDYIIRPGSRRLTDRENLDREWDYPLVDDDTWDPASTDEQITDELYNRDIEDNYTHGDVEEHYFLEALDPDNRDVPPQRIVNVMNDTVTHDLELHDAIYRLHCRDAEVYNPRRLSTIFAMSLDRIEGILKLGAVQAHYRRIKHPTWQVAESLRNDPDEDQKMKDEWSRLRDQDRVVDPDDIYEPTHPDFMGPHQIDKARVSDYTPDVVSWDPRYAPYPFANGANQENSWALLDDGPETMKYYRKARRDMVKYFETLPEKMERAQARFFKRYGPMGSNRDLREPEQLSDVKTRPARHNWILTDISDVKNARYAIAVRDKDGTLREPTLQEYTHVRKRERHQRDRFAYVKYRTY